MWPECAHCSQNFSLKQFFVTAFSEISYETVKCSKCDNKNLLEIERHRWALFIAVGFFGIATAILFFYLSSKALLPNRWFEEKFFRMIGSFYAVNIAISIVVGIITGFVISRTFQWFFSTSYIEMHEAEYICRQFYKRSMRTQALWKTIEEVSDKCHLDPESLLDILRIQLPNFKGQADLVVYISDNNNIKTEEYLTALIEKVSFKQIQKDMGPPHYKLANRNRESRMVW